MGAQPVDGISAAQAYLSSDDSEERSRRVEGLMRNLIPALQKRSEAPSPPSHEPTPSLTEEAKDQTLNEAQSMLSEDHALNYAKCLLSKVKQDALEIVAPNTTRQTTRQSPTESMGMASMLAPEASRQASRASGSRRVSLSHPARPAPRDSDLADIASLQGTQIYARSTESPRRTSITSADRDAVNPFLN